MATMSNIKNKLRQKNGFVHPVTGKYGSKITGGKIKHNDDNENSLSVFGHNRGFQRDFEVEKPHQILDIAGTRFPPNRTF